MGKHETADSGRKRCCHVGMMVSDRRWSNGSNMVSGPSENGEEYRTKCSVIV